jgi:hypothetical protein
MTYLRICFVFEKDENQAITNPSTGREGAFRVQGKS